jgi:hypothetical protein
VCPIPAERVVVAVAIPPSDAWSLASAASSESRFPIERMHFTEP